MQPDMYVAFEEFKSAGGNAGLHLITLDDKLVVYLRYHSTPLWKYGAANGIRKDIVDFCDKHGIGQLIFENINPKYIGTHTISIAVLKRGILDNLGGKGQRYYVPIDKWNTKDSLPIDWTDKVAKLNLQYAAGR